METTILEEQGLFQAVFAANGQSVQAPAEVFMASALTDTLFRAGIITASTAALASTGNGAESTDIRDAVSITNRGFLPCSKRKGTKSSVFW